MRRPHIPLRSVVTTLLLILGLYTNSTHAGVIEDANRLLDWAEAQYPNFFAPPNQPTQEAYGYVFRYYPATQTYAGVNVANRTVHVLGPIFGPDILTVGPLDALLGVVDSSSGGSSGEGGSRTCVYMPDAVQGTWSQITSYDVSGNYTGTYERSYHMVTDTYVGFSDKFTAVTPDAVTGWSGEGEVWYYPSDDYWSEDRYRYSILSQFITLDVLGETYTDTNTSTQTDEYVYDSPGLQYLPKRLCEGDSWDNAVGCTITTTEDGVVTSTSTEICTAKGKVEAINVPYTVPAGTFNTVKFVSDDGSVDYVDTETGTLVFQDLGPSGTNVLTSITSGN